jgi:hypothetical protein
MRYFEIFCKYFLLVKEILRHLHSHSARGEENRGKRGRNKGKKKSLRESRHQVTGANKVAEVAEFFG